MVLSENYLSPREISQKDFEEICLYYFAGNIVPNKSVLDLSCGNGAGIHYLAQFATKATGMNHRPDMVAQATEKFQRDNLNFREGTYKDINPDKEDLLDLIILFFADTVVPLSAQAEFLLAIQHLLKPDGLLLISIPIPPMPSSSDLAGIVPQLLKLLAEKFTYVSYWGLKMAMGASIQPFEDNHDHSYIDHTIGSQPSNRTHNISQVIALLSDIPIPELQPSFTLDRSESLIEKYYSQNSEFDEQIQIANQINFERTREIQSLRRELQSKEIAFDAISANLNEIMISKAYKLSLLMRRIRLMFIPSTGLLKQLPYSLKRGYRIFRNWGFRELLIRGQRKLVKASSSRSSEALPKLNLEFQSFSDVYANICQMVATNQTPDFVPLTDEHAEDIEKKVKLIAFYLPQFHPIKENDLWWGKGFTEWANVSKAIPQFEGHYQPHLPGELGFYDLRVPDVQRRQVELARQYGIHGFCFYYYWFNGTRLLERPLEQFITDSEIDFPFCVCWANENWTRRWDGREKEILIEQEHTLELDGRIIHDLIPLFKNKNYICIEGRPLFIIYRADILEDPIGTLNYWRKATKEAGLEDPYLVVAQTFNFVDPRHFGFDAAVSFPPHNVSSILEITPKLNLLNKNYKGNIFYYPELVHEQIRNTKPEPYRLFKTVFPSWDNEPRQPGRGFTYAFSTPASYKRWLFEVSKFAINHSPEEERFVFINAWNEWAEGAHLEPDRRFGYAYLQATLDTLKALAGGQQNMDGEFPTPFGAVDIEGTAIYYKKKFIELDRSGNFLRRGLISEKTGSINKGSRLIEIFKGVNSIDMQNPLVSIIIPVFNHFDDTVKCLHSIYQAGDKTSCEIIIADDGSDDETESIFSQMTGLRYIRNPENLGFLRSCNRAAAFAKGSYVMFLNNDTLVLPGWLDSIIATFKLFPQAGLVGSKLIYPDGKLQEAGGIIWRDASGINYGREEDPYHPKYNYLRDVDYCSGASICIPLKIWRELDGFDPLFAPAYYEDADFAFRCRERGYQVLYQPLSQLIHVEGVTSGTDVSTGVKHFQEVNREKFFTKWDSVLTNHCDPSDPEVIFRNRIRKERALVIDVCTPKPDHDAGSINTYQYLLMLRKIGFEVTFLSDVDAEVVDRYVRDLQKRGIECVYKPYLISIDEYIKQNGKHFSLVFLVRAPYGGRYINVVRKYARHAKVVFDTVDLHFIRQQRESKFLGGELKHDGELLMNEEVGIMKKSDITIVVSEFEQDFLRSLGKDINSRVIPLTDDIPGRAGGFEGRKNIVFIGGYMHKPNVDAVLYFVKEIWPLVAELLPDCEFWMVGSNLPEELERLAGERIKAIGFVQDLSQVFSVCKISIAPLRYGAGIKGKVITSLSYGVPCVLTSIAAEGMGLTHELNALVADSPQEFASAVVKLYTNDETWLKVSNNGLDYVKEKYSLDVFEKNLYQLVTDLGLKPS